VTERRESHGRVRGASREPRQSKSEHGGSTGGARQSTGRATRSAALSQSAGSQFGLQDPFGLRLQSPTGPPSRLSEVCRLETSYPSVCVLLDDAVVNGPTE
jgi:hypothetical protein